MDEDTKHSMILQRFGRYLILDHLVDGGMAKICRARFLGDQADKIVAIKMIRPQYSENPSFKTMFMDEIRVTFGLMHPNIAQTYEYGLLNGQLYTAMEYIDGKNLKQFLDRLKEQKYIFPIEISIHIITQVCQALSYAHNFTDKLSGKTLNIIHRDISPHNIMITYDGTVKVIDFGIAKATTNSEETQAGTIKGKLSYLAPEYLEGLPLDHRYDQFAIGITLWEMLCGRKLFQASNELAILKKIQMCQVPTPSSINTKIAPELDAIVLKALSKSREGRYENMEQLNRALVKYLYGKYPDFNPADLGHFAKRLFKSEIQVEHEKFFEFGKINLNPFVDEMKKEDTQTGIKPTPPSTPGKNNPLTEEEHVHYIDLEVDEKDLGDEIVGQLKTDSNRFKKGENLANRTMRSVNPITKKGPSFVSTTSNQEIGNIVQQNARKQQATSFFKLILVLLGLGIVSFGIYWVKDKMLFKEVKQSETTTNTPLKKSPETELTILITNTNSEQKFFINNKLVELTQQQLKIPLNQKIDLRVEQINRYPIFMTFNLTRDSSKVLNLPNARMGHFGMLDASSKIFIRNKISFYLDGHFVEWTLPISNKQLPAGTYEATLSNEYANVKKKITFTISEDTVTNLSDYIQD